MTEQAHCQQCGGLLTGYYQFNTCSACYSKNVREAQPADHLREDIQPINTGPKKPAVVGRRAAQPAAPASQIAKGSQEPDMRHPKIQHLIGMKARREIELRIIESIVDDPEYEASPMDSDYWTSLHDKVAALKAEVAQPAAQGPTDAKDAARWRMLPAFFEEYQIDAMKLFRDIDEALAAQPAAQDAANRQDGT